MNLKCYKISDEPNKIVKTLGTAFNINNGVLREPSSVENPVIQIEIPSSGYFDMNYCYLDSFKRYYFIVDKKMDGPTLCTLTLKVDVLYTYRTVIGNTPMLIERSENRYNKYITDSNRVLNNYPMILTKAFPTSWDSLSYYLTVAAG